MKKDRLNIGLLTFPISETGNIPLSNLVDIVYQLSNDLYLITGNNGYMLFKEDKRINTCCGLQHEEGANAFTRVLRYIYIQLRMSYKLAKITRNVDLWIFFIGGEGLVLPLLTARLLRKKVVLALAGFPAKGSQVQKDTLSKVTSFLSKINIILSNTIIAYSERVVEERGLENYRDKIYIAHEHFLDFDKFRVKKKFIARKNTVGYIGGLFILKGILSFVDAIPKVLEKENEIKCVIGGDGALFNEIKEFIDKNKLNDKVKILGWIPHDELPKYLNELKLLILPSYTEGLPNIMLEAMACGTPVLATPVGAIPDVIKDGVTGFIMEDNSAECIAENVMRALEHPDLERTVGNARALVEREFTYEAAVERYRTILENLGVEKCGQRRII